MNGHNLLRGVIITCTRESAAICQQLQSVFSYRSMIIAEWGTQSLLFWQASGVSPVELTA